MTPDIKGLVERLIADAMPCTAEKPREDAYQHGKFEGVMEYRKNLTKQLADALEHLSTPPAVAPVDNDAKRLLPCPFCGSEPHDGNATVWCDMGDHPLIQMPTEIWNTRTPPAVPVTPVADYVMVPREKLVRITAALDDALGDTDPSLPPDFSDDEVRNERPVFWACQQLALLLTAAPVPAHSDVREALEDARSEIVVAIAFLGRDQGTERFNSTVEGLIKRLVEVDRKCQAAISTTAQSGDQK